MGETPTPAAEKLQEYADNLSEISDELTTIEESATADEISYTLRDGHFLILELSYNVSKSKRPTTASPPDMPRG